MFSEQSKFAPGAVLALVFVSLLLSQGCKDDHGLVQQVEPELHQNEPTQRYTRDVTMMEMEIPDLSQSDRVSAYKLVVEQRQNEARAHAQTKPQVSSRTPNCAIDVPADYATLQDAVDAAAPGCVITISADLSETWPTFVTTSDITIRGASGSVPTVESAGLFLDAAPGNISNVRVTGLNLVLDEGVVVFNGDDVMIDNNTITSTFWTGLSMYFTNNSMVENNAITGDYHAMALYVSNNNQVKGNALAVESANPDQIAGLFTESASGNTIENCTFDGSSLVQGWGFWLASGSDNNLIKGCTSTNNSMFGFIAVASNHNEFKNCTATANDRGYFVFGGDGNTYIGCTSTDGRNGIVAIANGGLIAENVLIKDCDLSNNTGAGVFLRDAVSSTIRSSAMTNNAVGLFDLNTTGTSVRDATISANLFEGVWTYGPHDFEMRDCVSTGNDFAGVLLQSGTDVQLRSLSTTENSDGLVIFGSNNVLITDSYSADNEFCDLFQIDNTNVTITNSDLGVDCSF